MQEIGYVCSGKLVIFRPMTAEDIEAAYEVTSLAFAEDEERRSVLDRTPEEVATRHERYRRFLRTDPEGMWVAEDGGCVVGVAAALRCEGLWILSQFAVDVAYRGGGVGKALLRHALDYGEGCEGALIASSSHPAAMRRYALAGCTLHPTLAAEVVVDRLTLPPKLAVRDGDENDLEFAAEVDRHLRGATHGPDLEFMLDSGGRLLVSEGPSGGGYVVVRDGPPGLVAAMRGDVASELLWACLADAPEAEVEIRWITGAQNWAVGVALAAGLSLRPAGPICTKGETGPLAPYLPSGAFL